ncbi:hypothetical protein [Aeromonas jandaei]|uniref:hypothetical protein n=1 Tax=Aeromonas jandaei TaxID=650 RepID=UPI002B05393F|nr:hypothetical protein [Aeromonas jandaei]
MINKNALVYCALFFSCAPCMTAHAKYGDEIPFQIKAYIEADTCSVVTSGSQELHIELPDIPLHEVEEMYKKNTTKQHSIKENLTITCANGKSARFTYYNNNECTSTGGSTVGCLVDNQSLGFDTTLHYARKTDNVLLAAQPDRNRIRETPLVNKKALFTIFSTTAHPIKGQTAIPGKVGADVILSIWTE